MRGEFLFSVDLEDVRDHVRDGHGYSERVPQNTERYLRFLAEHSVQATFFVVGLVAERYPGLIRDIVAEGHELACHTHTHVQLDRHTPESLHADLGRNLDALARCGAGEIAGFRAPTFSLTERAQWAYPVLERLGLRYSTSVHPGRHPLYGWPGFGAAPRRIGGILELPLTLHPAPLRVPVAGGVHLRVMPFVLIERTVKRLAREGRPIQSYLHPYDIDTGQERFMHPDLHENRFYNALMYVGRAKVFGRLERLMRHCRFTSYREHLARARYG